MSTMALQAAYFKKILQFNFKARTSRGQIKDKTSWFIKLWDTQYPYVYGIGESSPLPGLSIDDTPHFEEVLKMCIEKVVELQSVNITSWSEIIPPQYPSLLFGFETAWLDLQHGGKRMVYDNSFVHGVPIPINGLIWMGDMDFMMNQINEKIAKGFRCIKIKVGGLDFDRECDILSYIRKRYYRDNVTIRLDANGAFKTDDVLFRLSELSKYAIHSIEQPIQPGLSEMEELCRKSPIPIAFDEELIGKRGAQEKRNLLERLRPAYIILKPMLHGGLFGCAEWISIAQSLGIGWWMTSALESSIGLNAICQFTANYPVTIPHGLGTGQIFINNIASPLVVSDGSIVYSANAAWNEAEMDGLSL
jgi:O-succinylbenzoate synthase